jgi:oligopeptide transport system permease protein
VTNYFVRKIGTLIASLFIVATVTFFLMQAVPGDPFTQDKAVPEEILKSMQRYYGLDKPWYVQYGKYLVGLATWNLGPSFKYQGRTVNEIIGEGFPVSLTLGLEALCIALGAGLILGTISALKRGKWHDHLTVVIAVFGISVPSFIMATCLQYVFAIQLDLVPVARWGSVAQSILPSLSLAALPTAYIARLTRANMLEVLQQDYIQTARCKGLNTFQVVTRHVLRNALMPVVTYLGPLTAAVVTGSFIVEKIFGIPGLGNWFVTSITNRDYTVIMGTTVFYSALLLGSVFFVDILYGVLDPRLKKLRHT